MITDEPVLTTVKNVVGVAENDHAFDMELITHTNAALFDLRTIGYGTWQRDSHVTSASDKWSDVLNETEIPSAVPHFIGLKVKRAFDPPSTGSQAEALAKLIENEEWRLLVYMDGGQ